MSQWPKSHQAAEEVGTSAGDVASGSLPCNPRGHVEEVREFLACSRVYGRYFAAHIERIRAWVRASQERSEDWVTRSAQFAAHIDEMRALLSRVEEVDGVRSELARGRYLLEREHAKFLGILRRISMPTLITDGTPIVRDANPAAAAHLGVSAESALRGRLLVSFVARQDVATFRDFAKPLWVASGGDTEDIVLRMRPRGGAVIATRLSVQSVCSESQRKVALLWTMRATDDSAA